MRFPGGRSFLSYNRFMKPRDLTESDLQQLFSSMTNEEHDAVRLEAQEIARRYADLPPEVAAHLRQRDLSALVIEMITRVMGGSVRCQ